MDSTSMQGGYATLSGTSATPAQVQAALIGSGTTDWNDADDPDGTKEKLLNVASY